MEFLHSDEGKGLFPCFGDDGFACVACSPSTMILQPSSNARMAGVAEDAFRYYVSFVMKVF